MVLLYHVREHQEVYMDAIWWSRNLTVRDDGFRGNRHALMCIEIEARALHLT